MPCRLREEEIVTIHVSSPAIPRGWAGSALQLLMRIRVTIAYAPPTDPAINTFQLLGDPELLAWTDTPGQLELSLSSSSDFAHVLFSVTATVESDSNPVEDALVCLHMGEDIYATCLSDENGEAAFGPFRVALVDTLLITASAPNKWPAQLKQPLSSWVRHARYASHEVDITDGNGDAVLEAGETFDLDVFRGLAMIGQVALPQSGQSHRYNLPSAIAIFCSARSPQFAQQNRNNLLS